MILNLNSSSFSLIPFFCFVTDGKHSIIDVESSMIHSMIQNYIYLLSCVSCGIQYVGESVINVNLRMNIHRRGHSGWKITINNLKGSKFIIQVFVKLAGNGYRNSTVDSEMLDYRWCFKKHFELYIHMFWIKEKSLCAQINHR